MSWLKKGPVFSVLGGFLILWLLVFFFFDAALKAVLVRGGRAAAGAQVEISSLRTKWLSGTLELRGLAVADRERPMMNLFELSRAGFHLDVSAALRGKAVVREAALEGLRMGTPRKTSGALPHPPPPSKLDLAVREKLAPSANSSLAKLGAPKTAVPAALDASKLAGLKKYDEAKAKAQEIEKRWQSKSTEAAQIEKESKDVAQQLKALGGGDILKKAAEAQKAQQKIKALIARVETLREQAKKDMAEASAALKEADALRQKDLNGLLSEAGLPSLDAQDMTRRLLGAQTAARVATALKWMRLARQKASAGKTASPPSPARRKGIDVEFPRAHSYPQFLLEGAKITGSVEGLYMGQDMALSGLLTGLTSNPKLYGKPALLDLSGSAAGGTMLKFSARLDQQNDPVGVEVKFEGAGFSLAGAALGDAEVGGAIKNGKAKVSGAIRSAGDEWKGEILLEATGVSLEPKVSLSGAAGTLLSGALQSITNFNVRVAISGREDDLKLAFSSNIGDAASSAVKKAVSGQLDAQRKALEAKVNALYGDKAKGAQEQVGGLNSKVLGPLDAQRAGLDRQLKDALGKALGGSNLPNFNKLFK